MRAVNQGQTGLSCCATMKWSVEIYIILGILCIDLSKNVVFIINENYSEYIFCIGIMFVFLECIYFELYVCILKLRNSVIHTLFIDRNL